MAPLPQKSRAPRSVEAAEAGKDRPYKSPQRKLVRFFARSRAQWKEKCLAAKALVKGLKNRGRFLERSKDYWKRRVKALERELAQRRAHEQAMREEIDALKKSLEQKSGG
jgi:predicted  nucleic acid-binding Zn-ribbon protein